MGEVGGVRIGVELRDSCSLLRVGRVVDQFQMCRCVEVGGDLSKSGHVLLGGLCCPGGETVYCEGYIRPGAQHEDQHSEECGVSGFVGRGCLVLFFVGEGWAERDVCWFGRWSDAGCFCALCDVARLTQIKAAVLLNNVDPKK